MTNKEFQNKLQEMYKAHPMIARSKKKTVNEILYMLRMDKENDYNVNLIEDGVWTCIPSVKECFIPVKTLAKHVKSIECDETDYGFECKEICLTIVAGK